MPDLVSTAGLSSTNSFLSQDDASTYLDARLNSSAWSGASSSDKDRALISASRYLSRLEWDGRRATSTQALSWPRFLVQNPDDPNLNYFSQTEIPQRVKDATCELALEMLKAGATDILGEDSSLAVKSETVGPISVTYADPSQKLKGLGRYPSVMDLLRPLLTSLPQGQLRLVRG